MSLRQRDRRTLVRDEAEDLEIADAQGAFLFDTKGRRYVDFLSGAAVGNLGWTHDRVHAKMRRFSGPPYVRPSFLYEPWVELAEELADIAPGKLRKTLRAATGTEAVEIALQASIAATGRHKFLSLEGAYHGNSIAARSIGSPEHRTHAVNLLPHCYKIVPPLGDRAAARAEAILRKRDIAAFIMEPIVCSLGVLIPRKEFVTRLQELCAHYGTLFVADEVATGFGRTGKVFAAEHYDLEPDIMCLGKGITGGYAPLAATMITPAVAKAIDNRLDFSSTYAWYPLAVEAALANVRFFRKRGENLMEQVARTGNHFRVRLSRMPFKHRATVRVRGLAIGVDVARREYAAKVRDRCRENGVIVGVEASSIVMFPPLSIDKKTARRGLDVLEECL
jgi:adenosylmethionine-8-amino-7-oxononanoate aminotransferase